MQHEKVVSNKKKTSCQCHCPGPGSYNVGGEFDSARRRGWSWGGRYQPTKATNTPGPGCYHDSSPKLNTRGGHFSISKYNHFTNKTPGPGQYNYNTGKGLSATIGKETRLRTESAVAPGPGAYNPALGPRSPLYTLRPKVNKNLWGITQGPGPADYKPQTKQRRGVSIGGGPKLIQNVSKTPGPGDYRPKTTSSAIHFSFGKNARLNNEPAPYPGPGAYEGLPANKTGYTMASKSLKGAFETNTVGPGPGAYSPQVELAKPSSPRVKFYTGPAGTDNRTIAPGPGQYSTPKHNSPGIRIGTGKKFVDYDKGTPGPGLYNVRPMTSAPSITMGNRGQSFFEPSERGPGPADYRTSEGWRKGVSIAKAKRMSELQGNTPGPGQYKMTQRKGPYITFPKDAKDKCVCHYE